MFSHILISVGCLKFLPGAFSFANVIFTIRNNILLRSLSVTSGNTENLTRGSKLLGAFSSTSENVLSDDIVRPELPPIGDSAKRLFLVRHGEVINPGGDRPVYYGAMDVSLSSLGEAEARAAALYLKYYDLDIVVSSPLSRAIFGAEQIVAFQKNLPKNDESGAVKMDGFKELDRGAWCGMTKDEIGSEMMARFDACDESVTPEGGESFRFVKERVSKERDIVLDRLQVGQAAAIVSHLQVTRCILGTALGIPTAEMAGLKIATASVTCIDYDATGSQTVHFKSFKPDVGLATSIDGAN